ncbi:uncharacterized protein [Littorina saxatilis]|uniref:uncharacterized protein n=1 Tax=Littorina saxatilis TaxID=31220 RepID=UPI0038B5934E
MQAKRTEDWQNFAKSLEKDKEDYKSLYDNAKKERKEERIQHDADLAGCRTEIEHLKSENKECMKELKTKTEQVLDLRKRIMELQHGQSAKGGKRDEESPQRDDICMNCAFEGASMGIQERPDNHDEDGEMEAAADRDAKPSPEDKTRCLYSRCLYSSLVAQFKLTN